MGFLDWYDKTFYKHGGNQAPLESLAQRIGGAAQTAAAPVLNPAVRGIASWATEKPSDHKKKGRSKADVSAASTATAPVNPGLEPDPAALAYARALVPSSGDPKKAAAELQQAKAIALQMFPPAAIQQLRAQQAMAAQGWTPNDLMAVARSRAAFSRDQGARMATLQDQLAQRQGELAQGTPFEGIAGTGQLGNLTRQLAEQQAQQDMGLPERLLRQSMGQGQDPFAAQLQKILNPTGGSGGGFTF